MPTTEDPLPPGTSTESIAATVQEKIELPGFQRCVVEKTAANWLITTTTGPRRAGAARPVAAPKVAPKAGAKPRRR